MKIFQNCNSNIFLYIQMFHISPIGFQVYFQLRCYLFTKVSILCMNSAKKSSQFSLTFELGLKKLTVDKHSKIRLKIECVLDSDVSEIGKEENRSLKYQRSLP